MAGVAPFCDPSFPGTSCQAIYFEQTSGLGYTVGSITGNFSAILGGQPQAAPTNNVNADFSTILNGDTNHINTFSVTTGSYNSIVNGQFNTMGRNTGTPLQVDFSTILGGTQNCIDTDDTLATQYATIAGGQSNRIQPGMDYAAIMGGDSHLAAGRHSFVGGGTKNQVDDCATVGGGEGNRAVEDYAAIFGGFCNHTNGHAAFIGGGFCNLILGNPNHPDCSAIAGGELNNIGLSSGGSPLFFYDRSFIGGGFTNNIFSKASSILGGATNAINQLSDCSFISGGQGNNIGLGAAGFAGATWSAIGGGQGNIIDDTGFATSYALIGGGQSNTICACTAFSAIFSGYNNGVAGSFSIIGGGCTNFVGANSEYSFVSGGRCNRVGAVLGGGLGACDSGIGGGHNNCIDDTLFLSRFSGIFSGDSHFLNANNSFIGGGNANNICSASGFGPVVNSVIAGGINNFITDDGSALGVTTADCSFVGGGNSNKVFSISSSIVGGEANCIANNIYGKGVHGHSFIGGGKTNCIFGAFSFIGDGEQNTIQSGIGGVLYSAIVGGDQNTISDDGILPAASSFIGGGQSNNVFGQLASVVGGSGNSAHGQLSFIGGGIANNVFINSNSSGVVSGCQNSIGNILGTGLGAANSFIGGGGNNCIDDAGSTTGWATIGGGAGNCIFPGTNHSSIFGGSGNFVSGSCSAILGGANNSDGGFPNTAVFGNTLVATQDPATMGFAGIPSAFWVDDLVAANIPMGAPGPSAPPGPPGMLWYYPDALGNKVVYVV